MNPNVAKNSIPVIALCSSIATLAIMMTAAPIQAAVYTLNLSGNVASATTSSFISGGSAIERHDQFYLNLGGMPSILIHPNDVINATVALNQSYTIPAPASATRLFFSLSLYGNSFYPDLVVGTETSVTFLNQGVPTYSTAFAMSAGTTSSVAAGIGVYPPNNLSITFDEVRFQSTVSYASFLFTVDSARLWYDVASPVPEPSSLALLSMGIGGFALLRKRRK